MGAGLSDEVRAVARSKYVKPAKAAGRVHFSIPVKDLLVALQARGFPLRNTPQVCTALQTSKFLRENGLEIEGVDGPPSKLSTTVVVRYRVTKPGKSDLEAGKPKEALPATSIETPEEWAHRVTAKIRGLMKDELAAYGGGEAFLRWVRGYDEEEG